jgi:hypothetical protein
MKLSLNVKIILVSAIPALAFLAMSAIRIQDDRTELENTNITLANVTFIEATSRLVHELQKERARTVAFLGGSMSQSDVDEQRGKVNETIIAFNYTKNLVTVDSTILTTVVDVLNGLDSFRGRINSKEVQKAEAIKHLTGAISNLLAVQMATANTSNVVGIPLAIRSVATLESIKESLGRLRANTLDALTSNSALPDEKFSLIVSLKGGVETNINSPLLVISPESKVKLKELLSNNNWKQINETIEAVLKKAQTGDFSRDSKEFYSTITSAIDDFAPIVSKEIDVLQTKVEAIRGKSLSSLWTMGIVSASIFFGLITLVWFAILSIYRPIKNAIAQISDASNQVTAASGEISRVSHELSTSSQEQASSIEQTSASLFEINQMITNNISSAQSANKQSQDVSDLAQETAQWMEDLKTAMKQILDSNDRITALAKIIEQVGEKTEVIDDIVFKTQLLSFNASVEAERAGEQGRGFAVVAQEVGNLAQMSGIAATEIASIVKTSIREAETVSNDNKDRVEKGESLVRETATRMNGVITKMTDILNSTKNILEASKEQSAGVGQITKTVELLNQSTQQSATTAEQCSSSGSEMASQAEILLNLVNQMNSVINGDDVNLNNKQYPGVAGDAGAHNTVGELRRVG